MRTTIYGRQTELQTLRYKHLSSKAELGVVYGRRRVGKSFLVRNFAVNHQHLFFEGLEGLDTAGQIHNFQLALKKQIYKPLLQQALFNSWEEIFDFLTSYLNDNLSHKTIILFDEFQWMAAGQSKLVALLKLYWDNHWKNTNVFLILCGSIASFMVRKVIRSKALYGRITMQLQIRKLSLEDSARFFKNRRSNEEVLKYVLTLGGVPKYLEDIDLSRSFVQNIESLFFEKDSLYLDEFTKIFNVHFKESLTYLKIVKLIDKKWLSLEEIAGLMKRKSSGGIKTYLENLELAEFIRPATSYDNQQSRYSKYKLSDEFLWFYIKYVAPNLNAIRAGAGVSLFRSKILKEWDAWYGFSFENYCVNNAMFLAKVAGFEKTVVSLGPLLKKSTPGAQFDLIFKRSDRVVTSCEIKYRTTIIRADIIPEVEKKLKAVNFPKGYTIERMIVAPTGISQELKDSKFFHHVVTLDDLFGVS